MNLRTLAALASLAATAQAVPSSLDATQHFAWAQNAGWVNGEPLGPGKDGVQLSVFTLSGIAWGQNIGWVNFGDGTPVNGLRYSNTDADDCGVNLDCDGNLSGFAWAQNAGFISFQWASAGDANRPRVDLGTREFHGYAWSQNLGWINLGAGFLKNSGAPVPFADTDGDGLPDEWELFRKGDLTSLNSANDTDHDGLADSWEFTHFAALNITNGLGDFDQDGSLDREEFAALSNPRNNLSLPPPTGSTIAGGFESSAWGQNTGWVNFRHDRPQPMSGVSVREYVLLGHAWAANLGWMDFGDGTPDNGIRYSNTTNTDYGVNHDGAGNLSGWAWSQSTGWVNFGWAAPGHPDRPRLSLSSGKFAGYAWGQNTGWIFLGFGLRTTSILLADADGDGMDDAWERERFGNLAAATATSDADGDGQRDLAEYLGGTDPLSAASLLRITAHSIDATRTMETLVFTSSATREYRVHSSPDLLDWQPSFSGWFTGLPASTETYEFLQSPQRKYFFRIEARRPLAP
jgi:hypothetical protein